MKKFIHIVLFASMITACKKEKPACAEPLPPEPKYFWSDYIGTYDVYDTVNHTQWVMKIKHLYHREYNQGNNDSVLIENFANKFTIRYLWRSSLISDKPMFDIGVFHPIEDNNSLKWHLSSMQDDLVTTKNENVLIKDSIILFFKQSNIAFYQNDGVSYYECDCKHIAVKRR